VKENQNPRRKSSTPAALTPREREILCWVAEGKRDSEIATILNLSVRTVEQHVRTCLRKLNVETRTAACAVLWRDRKSGGPGIQR
jgi:DNA-binding CsgD family transcriptional regulator